MQDQTAHTAGSSPLVTRLEPLIDNPRDERILQAARGLRPHFDDSCELDADIVQFSPSSGICKTSKNGGGTEVTFYGTTRQGHSIATVVNGFYPHLFVVQEDGLSPEALVAELNAALCAITALDSNRSWAAEYTVTRDSLVGQVRRRRDGKGWLLFEAREEEARARLPVVGYELYDVTMERGNGKGYGYRGIEPTRCIKLYFQAQAFLSRAKSIMHGRYADRGWKDQLTAFARGNSRLASNTTDAASAADEAATAVVGPDAGQRYTKLSVLMTMSQTVNKDGDDDDDDASDDMDVDGAENKAADANGDEPNEDASLYDKKAVSMLGALEELEEHLLLNDGEDTGGDDNERGTGIVFDNEPDDVDDLLTRLLLEEEPDSDATTVAANGIIATEDTPGKEGREILVAKANALFKSRALKKAEDVYGSGMLRHLREDAPLTLAEGDCPPDLQLCNIVGFTYEQWVDVSLRTQLDPSECYREIALEPHSGASGGGDGLWQAPFSPPGIAPHLFTTRRATGSMRKTREQIELHCDFHHMRRSDDEELQNTVAQRLCASFDCETELGENGAFPDMTKQRVLQTCFVIPLPHDRTRHRNVAFVLEQAESGPGRWVDIDDEEDDDDDTPIGELGNSTQPTSSKRKRHVEIAYETADVDEEPSRLQYDESDFCTPPSWNGSTAKISGDVDKIFNKDAGGVCSRLAVVGTRDFNKHAMFDDILSRISYETLVTGDARGADQLARTYAYEHGSEPAVHKAEWKKYNRRAGPLRNTEIVADSTHLIAFWDGKSPGTKDSISKAHATGLPCVIVHYIDSAEAQKQARRQSREKRAREAKAAAVANGRESRQRFVRQIDDPAVESEHVFCFRDERSKLLGMAAFIEELGANKFITYNGDNFDVPALLERANQNGVSDVFEKAWGRSRYTSRIRVRERVFESKAHGRHEFRDVTADGVLMFDLMQYLKRNPMIKLRKYSLDAVAEEYVGMHKVTISYADIPMLQKTPAGRRTLLVYCFRDCELPDLIDQKLTIELELVEKARATGVTLLMLLKRGMQLQCIAYLYRMAMRGIFIPEQARGIVDDAGQRRRVVFYTRTNYERAHSRGGKYMGATVFEPLEGLIINPVSTLDYMSLYPTVMRMANIDEATLIAQDFDWRNDAYLKHLVTSGFCREDQLMRTIETVDEDAPDGEFRTVALPGAARFLQQHVLDGLVPQTEHQLLLWRKGVKKQLAAAKKRLAALIVSIAPNKEIANARALVVVLDKRQLSIKLICNSLYGFFGADTSASKCIEMADSVTRMGRLVLLFAKYVADHVVNRLTLDGPIAQKVRKFKALKNDLLKIPSGDEVVDTLVREYAEIRDLVPPDVLSEELEMEERVLKATRMRAAKRRAEARGVANPQIKPDVADSLANPRNSLMRAFSVSRGAGAMVRDTRKRESASASKVDTSGPTRKKVRIRTVYGDTDSIFPRFWKGADMQRVARVSVALADFITILLHQRFPCFNRDHQLLRLEFEKTFRTILFLGKKRYAGLKWVYKWSEERQCMWLMPVNEDDEFAPSQSGLEVTRRDTTRLVAEGMIPVLSLLLDYRHTSSENMQRARAFIWRTMVDPLRDGTISMHKIVLSQQLRAPPESYRKTRSRVPAHVFVAEKGIERVGGPHNPGAPRPGDRIPYVIIAGLAKLKPSERAESPVYALEHGLRPDATFYLTNHVSPAFCRLFEPILNADKDDLEFYGASEKIRQKSRMKVPHAYLFGALKRFIRPSDADNYPEDLLRFADDRTFVRNPVRIAVRTTQKALGAFGALLEPGAKCSKCDVFFNGEYRGFTCTACVRLQGVGARRLVHAKSLQARRTVAALLDERALIYDNCQRCAGTAARPKKISCTNETCDVYWERLGNSTSLSEARKIEASSARVLYDTRDMQW